jgi:Polysaccharide lyase
VAGGISASADEGDSQPRLGIGPAHAVADSPPPPGIVRPPAPEATPVAAAPAPIPVATPIATTAPTASAPLPSDGSVGRGGGGQGGPIGAGGGPAGAGPEAVEVPVGEQRTLSFSFYGLPSGFRPPGDENLIVRFEGEDSETPTFGLQLWDDGGDQRGLWSSGEAMDGERFLAPVEEGVWHRAVLFFQAASDGDGFYLLFLDGQPIEARAGVSLIDPDDEFTRIEVGLFREGGPVVGSPEVLFGPVQVDESLESVIP